MQEATLHTFVRVIVRANDFFQPAESLLVTGRNDLPENFGELLDEFHRLSDQDWVPHDGGRDAKAAPGENAIKFMQCAAAEAAI